jgi:putative endonuclease
MTGVVYILFSLKDRKTYTGSTDNLERRLLEHQTGKVIATKNRLPLKLIYSEILDNIDDARKKEHYYKSCAGRKKLKSILDEVFKSLASIHE